MKRTQLPWLPSFSSVIAATLGLYSLSSCTKCSHDGAATTTSVESQSPQESTENPETIKIGEVGSMTGSEATFGVATHQGIMLAIDEINASGGVNGKKVEIITMDDQSKPEEAATSITKLITQDKVIAVLGEVASSRSLAMGAIAQDFKIPMVSPSSTNPKVTELGDYIFRVCFIDPFQGSVMAGFALADLKVKKVAILRDVKSDYSSGLSEFFRESLQKGGGVVVAEESYNAGDIDFKSQLTAIRASNPEAIFVPGYYTEVGLIARQARELALTQPLLGGDGWDSQKLWEIGGTALENSYFSNHYSSENAAPHVQSFIENFKKTYGVEPDGLAAAGYDAAKVLVGAMNSSTTLSPSDIRDTLAQTSNFQGVTGNITIDAKRNAVKSAVVLRVAQNGDFKYQTTINP